MKLYKEIRPFNPDHKRRTSHFHMSFKSMKVREYGLSLQSPIPLCTYKIGLSDRLIKIFTEKTVIVKQVKLFG